MMATTERIMIITVTLDGTLNAMDAIESHYGVRRYLTAGWALRVDGIIVKARAATVPLIAPECWPPEGEGVSK